MKIEKLVIKGFRNFIDTEIYFNNVSLIIGKNDIGKTNLLYALRILFDKKMSDDDLELTESDYNIFSKTNRIEIKAFLTDIKEDFLRSCFKSCIKDGKTIISYSKEKDSDYVIKCGWSDETMSEYNGRFYTKRVDLKYIDSQRDLNSYFKAEKKRLLTTSKEKLGNDEQASDEEKKKELQESLNTLNDSVNNFEYIKTALNDVSKELSTLSNILDNSNVRFSSGNVDAQKMLDNLTLVISSKEGEVEVSGEGKKNQVYFATWMTQRNLEKDDDHLTILAIEEPEAHLHPAQQRLLANYFETIKNEQIIITSHSPEIVCSFIPEQIIRLSKDAGNNIIASCGTKDDFKNMFDRFSYRLNPISAETFFSDGVFLVEGISEVLFYKSLAKAKKIPFESYNLSVLPVEGVGFKPYIQVCLILNIPFVMRTDNDIFAKDETSCYFAGLYRAIGLVKELNHSKEAKDLVEFFEGNKSKASWVGKALDVPEESKDFNDEIREKLKQFDIFLSDVDLETDIAGSELIEALKAHYHCESAKKTINAMKSRKAENMYGFLSNESNANSLSLITKESLLEPFKKLCEKAESIKVEK